MLADHVVQRVTVDAGGVDHAAGLQDLIPGGDLIQAIPAADLRHGAVHEKLHPVLGCVLRQGDGHAEGADDGAGGGIQSRRGGGGQGRLQLMKLLTADDA